MAFLRSFLRLLMVLAGTVALTSCVWVVSPLTKHPEKDVAEATQTAAKVATSCPRYRKPAAVAVPTVPDFTEEERNDPDKFSERLTVYIGVLRQYITDRDRDQSLAYRRYIRHCHDEDE